MLEASKDPYPKRKIEDPPQKKRWSKDGITLKNPVDGRQANSKELIPIVRNTRIPKANFTKPNSVDSSPEFGS